ncbi:MAG: ABC transporter permease [Thermoanaerobaculia bacterium]
MNSTMVIARREIADKKFVLVTAVAFAVLPFLLAIVPGTNVKSSGILVAATIFASGFAGALALILGASFIGRDITEGRMSFYFSRPVGSAAIWFGKLGAALLIVGLSFVIIFTPGWLLSAASGGWKKTFPVEIGAAMASVLVACLAFFLIAHVIGTFVRSRSAWIALDFGISVVLGFGIWIMLRRLFLGGATILFSRVALGLAAGLALSIIGAGAFQLANGRTDRVRSHLALSRFLWVAAGAVVLIAGAFVWWVVSATPQDLISFSMENQSSRGNAVVVAGQTRHRADYHAGFLLDPSTGAFERIQPVNWYKAEFVARGSKLLEITRSARSGNADVFLRDARPGATRFDPRVSVANLWNSRVAVTDDGSRMAVTDGASLSVYDLASRRSLGSVQRPTNLGRVTAMFFPSNTVVRLYLLPDQGRCAVCVPQSEPRTLSIFEFDSSSRKLTQTGAAQLGVNRYVRLGVSADGSRMLVRTDLSLTIHDARTGAQQMLAPGGELGFATTFLQDGGAAVAVKNGERAELRIVDADGSERRTIPLGDVRRIWPIREVAPGKLVAGVSHNQEAEGGWEVLSIDASTGQVLQRQPNLRAAFGDGLMWWNGTDPRRGLIDPAELYQGKDGLVRWNALTGEKKVLAPGT